MRECHLSVCPGQADQFTECRERAACHEAGHGLLVCVIASANGLGRQSALATLMSGYAVDGCFALPEGMADDPWNDSLVLLGGPAADLVVHGQKPREEGEDWRRAERLLRCTRVPMNVVDVFAATRELVEHHRSVLQAIAATLVERGAVSGTQMWQAFTSSLNEPPGATTPPREVPEPMVNLGVATRQQAGPKRCSPPYWADGLAGGRPEP